MLSRTCVPGIWGCKSRRFITLFQKLLRCYFRKRSSLGRKVLGKCPLSLFLGGNGRENASGKFLCIMRSDILVFPSFLTTQAVKSNWSDSQGWSRHSSRKHYARTGPWCKQEFRTLMQMGVTENIRLMACWDGVVLIRRNIWKLTPSPEHNNA